MFEDSFANRAYLEDMGLDWSLDPSTLRRQQSVVKGLVDFVFSVSFYRSCSLSAFQVHINTKIARAHGRGLGESSKDPSMASWARQAGNNH